MMKRGNTASLALSAAGCILGAAALILYAAKGVNDFILRLDPSVIALAAIGAVLAAVAVVSHFFSADFDGKLIPYIAFLLLFSAWFAYLNSEMSYLANVLVGIDPTGLKPEILYPFIFTFGLLLLSSLCALFAAILLKNEFGKAAAEGGKQ